MIKLDHLTIAVRDYGVSRDCYTSTLGLYFQVDDVEAKYQQLVAANTQFNHPPQKQFWGYGAELCDPDGYRLRLWDEQSMREKGRA